MAIVSVSDTAEKALLGNCLAAPYLLDYCSDLKPEDFRSRDCARVFEAMRVEAKRVPLAWDIATVAFELERVKAIPPANHDWIMFLASLLAMVFKGFTVCDEDATKEYVRIVKSAALLRRMELMGKAS